MPYEKAEEPTSKALMSVRPDTGGSLNHHVKLETCQICYLRVLAQHCWVVGSVKDVS